MTREEALRKLAECQASYDQEIAHMDADRVLCELLDSLGFHDVVLAYNAIPKWFA